MTGMRNTILFTFLIAMLLYGYFFLVEGPLIPEQSDAVNAIVAGLLGVIAALGAQRLSK